LKNKIVKIRPSRRTKSFDGISLRQKAKVVEEQAAEKKRFIQFEFLSFTKRLFVGRQLSAVLIVMLLFAGFLTGFWFTWQTHQTGAEAQVLGVMDTAPVEQEPVSTSTVAGLSDDTFYKLTVSQIEEYLNEAVKTPQLKEAERLAERKVKLKAYLEDKGSPFVEISDSIAELPHWKMVLAISNSESTMGKRCHSNNCSGIGVAPGHPLWREYASTKDWAKDLNKLLERRYKDWTLEQMNGVYNQPGSRNWVRASKQVLEELQEREIN
jgi:hypothetical protein